MSLSILGTKYSTNESIVDFRKILLMVLLLLENKRNNKNILSEKLKLSLLSIK